MAQPFLLVNLMSSEKNKPENATETVAFRNLAAGGETVGRDNSGQTVFAHGGAPGETAQVRITDKRKNFARGVIAQIDQVSPFRVAAPCPHFGVVSTDIQQRDLRPENGCGGCAWQHIEYSMQAQSKRDVLVQALRRVAGLENAESLVENCLVSPHDFAYRNKADVVVAAQNGETRIGFRARESHDVVDVAQCLIQSDGNNSLLRLLREGVARKLVAPFDAQQNRGVLKRAVLRTSSRDEKLIVLETTPERWPQAAQFADFLMQNAPHLRGVLARTQSQHQILAGRDWLEEAVLDLKLRVIGGDFFQINTLATPLLLSTALELAQVQSGERVLDLYCGVGLFALALAKRGAVVTGIEYNARAIETARENAKRNGCDATFLAGDAARTLQKWRAQSGHERVDLVVLDPPRAGAKECLDEIVALAPRRIVYVSCDVATLARDVKILGARGFSLRRAVPLDLFPQTSHVETAALLEAS